VHTSKSIFKKIIVQNGVSFNTPQYGTLTTQLRCRLNCARIGGNMHTSKTRQNFEQKLRQNVQVGNINFFTEKNSYFSFQYLFKIKFFTETIDKNRKKFLLSQSFGVFLNL